MKAITIRLTAVLAALFLCVGLAACGGTPAEEASAPAKTTTTTTTTAAEDSAPGETAATTTTAEKLSTTVTTTSRTKNIQGGIVHTTVPTEAPTTTAPPQNPIRVLAIGHSFAVDALRTYMWDLLHEAGYDYVVVGYLYTPSCSLDEQWDRMQGKADHEQYCKTDPYTGSWSYHFPEQESPYNKVQYAIRDEQWDVITLQPDPDYGAGVEFWPNNNDYTHVGDIIQWINRNKTNPKGQLMYHMTWSFAEDCRLWCFKPFDYDPVKQYNAFAAATQKYIFDAHPNKFAKVIPAGTSIQNARTSRLGNAFNLPGNYDPNADGYHLNDKGDYVAALTWYATLTGKSAKTAWCPEAYKADFAILAEAVDNAIRTPYAVTQSSYK